MKELFPGQRPEERIIAVVRPHWLVLLRQIILGIFLLLTPPIVLVVLGLSGVAILETPTRAILAVALPAYYLSIVTWLFIAWLDYYLDVGVVTSQRVVDIDQQGLFQRRIAELESSVIQDVAAEKHGVLQTMFNFGNVKIQTAGERPNFSFTAVPKPEEFVMKITDTYKVNKQEEAAEGEVNTLAKQRQEAAHEEAARQEPAVEYKPDEAAKDNKPPVDESKQETQDIPREFER